MLKATFETLVYNYSGEPSHATELWAAIEKEYSGKKRFYHNLAHLENMLRQLESCRNLIDDWDTTLFALFYHDVIYKATAKDNEEKSAEAAVDVLHKLNFPESRINKCGAMILATKLHTLDADNDTNLFTDADLSILGSNWDDYLNYCKNVRKEYSIYPDFMYNAGRKKVLQQFLDMENIFKTGFFRGLYEEKARKNLKQEIDLL